MTKRSKNSQWQKILYRRQPFPDNYSGGDQKFLSELRNNVSVVHYDYRKAMLGGTILLAHLDTLAMYFVLFLNTMHDNWDLQILYSVFFCVVASYIFYCKCLSSASSNQHSKNDARTITSLLLFGYAFTPVIRTLTTSISTDTIYAVSIITAILSCIFHDYGVRAPVVSYPMSMSSGLCSAIFLLSRLENNTPAFILLVIAFVLHAYCADFRNRMFSIYPMASIVLSVILSISSTYFLSEFSVELSIVWIILHLFVLFVCPYILVSKQTGKCTIHGPWDEAVPLKTAE